MGWVFWPIFWDYIAIKPGVGKGHRFWPNPKFLSNYSISAYKTKTTGRSLYSLSSVWYSTLQDWDTKSKKFDNIFNFRYFQFSTKISFSNPTKIYGACVPRVSFVYGIVWKMSMLPVVRWQPPIHCNSCQD